MTKTNLKLIKVRSLKAVPPPREVSLGKATKQNTSRVHAPTPFQCKPWVDSAKTGLELCYFQSNYAEVSATPEGINIDGDFDSSDFPLVRTICPFSSFAPGFYSLATFMDLIPPPDHSISISTHTSFFLDQTGAFPCAVPGNIESDWWPRHIFVVFKSPPIGETHRFEKGMPYCKIALHDRSERLEVSRANGSEVTERSMLELDIAIGGQRISTRTTSYYGKDFTNIYKVMSGKFETGGKKAVTDSVGPQGSSKMR